MARWTADILMYHSISDRGGPTSILPEVFEMQMETLAASGVPVVSMDDIAEGTRPERSVVLTFDDAFVDFATAAWPVLEKHGFPAMVYVPTAGVGAVETWEGALTPPRPIMDWNTIRRLADAGVHFGNHSVSHPDLTKLGADDLREEIASARATLENELGRPVRHFAAPYGKSSATVNKVISIDHVTGVGTRLGQADARSDLLDLPRIEMFYFSSRRTWQRHLEGRGTAYLAARRGLRAVRNIAFHPARRA